MGPCSSAIWLGPPHSIHVRPVIWLSIALMQTIRGGCPKIACFIDPLLLTGEKKNGREYNVAKIEWMGRIFQFGSLLGYHPQFLPYQCLDNRVLHVQNREQLAVYFWGGGKIFITSNDTIIIIIFLFLITHHDHDHHHHQKSLLTVLGSATQILFIGCKDLLTDAPLSYCRCLHVLLYLILWSLH